VCCGSDVEASCWNWFVFRKAWCWIVILPSASCFFRKANSSVVRVEMVVWFGGGVGDGFV
jgi:hypothetical protein